MRAGTIRRRQLRSGARCQRSNGEQCPVLPLATKLKRSQTAIRGARTIISTAVGQFSKEAATVSGESAQHGAVAHDSGSVRSRLLRAQDRLAGCAARKTPHNRLAGRVGFPGGNMPEHDIRSFALAMETPASNYRLSRILPGQSSIVSRPVRRRKPPWWETTAASQAGGPSYILTNRCNGSTWAPVRTVVNDAKGNPTTDFVYRLSPLGVDNSSEAVLSYGLPSQISK
jgi:hypothetical protein